MQLARLSQESKEVQGRADEPLRMTPGQETHPVPRTLGGPLPSLGSSLQVRERATLSERMPVD